VSLADFESQLLSLSESDRIHLVELLWDSLASADVQERTRRWAAEAERRWEAVQSGQLLLADADQVFQELRAKTRR